MSRKLRAQRREKTRAARRRRAIQLAIIGGFLVAAGGFFAWRLSLQAETTVPADTLSLGAAVYAENCAACHGPNGEGHAAMAAAPALDASEHAWHHADGQLQQIILEGGQSMPGFQGQLSNEEVLAVIRYFQTWWAPGQLQSQQSLSQQFPFED